MSADSGTISILALDGLMLPTPLAKNELVYNLGILLQSQLLLKNRFPVIIDISVMAIVGNRDAGNGHKSLLSDIWTTVIAYYIGLALKTIQKCQ